MIGIMQPYFLPYLGHIQLMEKCNKWVIFDDIQVIDKGWINRNKILHPNAEKKFQFITIPIKNRTQKSLISSLEIDNSQNWREDIRGKLSFYKNKAERKNFLEGQFFLNQILNIKTKKLSEFLHEQILIINEYFNLDLKIILQSKDIKTINHKSNIKKDEWAIEITKFLNGKIYINPISGIHLFNKHKFDNAKIELKSFTPEINDISHNNKNEVFSIIDTLIRYGYSETILKIKQGIIQNI